MASFPNPGDYPELDAETRVPILVGVSIAFLAFSSIMVLLRLYTRFFVVRSAGADDYTIVFAQVLNIGVAVTTILQANYGLGRHVWLVDQVTTIKQLQSLFAGEVIYNMTQIMTKVSILLQYRRIFRDDWTKRVSLWLMIFLLVWGAVQEVLVGMACIPISILYPSQAAICINSLMVWYLTSVMNIITDFVVFMVPMPVIKNLQLRKRQKLLVVGIFCLGFFTCIISIVRLFTLSQAINSADTTWDNTPTSYWTEVEVNLGIVCASAATLRPLVRRLVPGTSNHEDSYVKQPATPKTGSQLSRSQQRDPAEVYPLDAIGPSTSQERLKGGEADYYQQAEYARHPKNTSRLTTAISGGKRATEPSLEDTASEESLVPTHIRSMSGGEIRVTRETTFQESRGEKRSHIK
ncbi:hypothetical protein GQ53DRAFT_678044, partial [Thozetella sp. PMI_491]